MGEVKNGVESVLEGFAAIPLDLLFDGTDGQTTIRAVFL